VLLFPIGSHLPTYAQASISISDNGFNLESDVVPSNLHWSKKSIQLAKQVQRFLYRSVKAEIESLRRAGAVKIVRVSHPTDSGVRNWQKLNLSSDLYSLDGFDSQGNLVLSGATLFEGEQAIQSRTVYLGQESCLLRGFGLFDIETWFTPQCSINVEPREKFLRASMQSWLSLVGGFSPDGNAISHELQTVVSENLKYRVDSKSFYCLGCKEYFKTPYAAFPLEYSKGLWPYQIKYQASSDKFTLKIFKPNYLDLMNQAHLVSDTLIRFDDPAFFSTPNSIFPLVP
jgi:hypothetical protein